MPQPGGPPSDRPVPTAPPPGAGLDPAADLVELFDRVRDDLLSTLLYMLGNADDAQDVAQETFLKCWRARRTVPDVQNLRAWVFRVGLNAAKDFQRSAWKKKSRPLPDDDLIGPAAGADEAGQAMDDREAVERLAVAIGRLRPEEREVFLLRQNGDLTYEQIADLRGAPVGTVKTQMRTALQKLRKVLNPDAAAADE